ncbi:sigma-70 family RNA polymerase sigma factor [Kribbella capetownensis]|uniref:Sigma-70 family RNA polymerase sigma factor n=1 Tax=Kribbella capetownensis TaxID=1572659 RepID=A0A4R0IQJ9_9ACTN|nr:sigma-70 family RNA polymerase sigma factor [Kribbella capetownensis]TCC35287.1 sigma-70 family RNA polymerase sigma factor [Kribbella capetownensis]
MDDKYLAERFQDHRSHLRAVAYQMLGSLSDADDAVQEAWIRLDRSNAGAIRNLGGWLTTVVGRVCLDMLRTRVSRREETFPSHLPDPIVSRADHVDPEQQAMLADSVGLALLVVMETLTPAERLAFVLHDIFGLQFTEIATIADRSPGAVMQLASRARRRVRGVAVTPDVDLAQQRELVGAFLAATRDGDLGVMIATLAPDVVLRVDRDGGIREVRGASAVAEGALTFSWLASYALHVTVNGVAGIVTVLNDELISMTACTVRLGKIVALDIFADRKRLSDLELTWSSPRTCDVAEICS